MAVLDNAIWVNGATGFAESGTTNVSQGGNLTTVTGTFTANVWDETQGGTDVSEFGAFGITSPINANYQFSNPVENLSFDFNHVNDDGASTNDDYWTIYAYDDTGTLINSATVIAGLSGVVDENIITNPDGSVSIEAAGTTANDVTLTLAGPVSELDLTFEPGPNGTASGGSGISDLRFDIPAVDTDGDGINDITDVDDDNDGILDVDEGFSSSSPSTIEITLDGDDFSGTDNTRWEIRDGSGTLINSGTSSGNNLTDIWTIPAPASGDYTFTVFDDFGDGLGGPAADGTAGYTVAVDGVTVIDSGNFPNFGSSFSHDLSLLETVTTTDSDGDGIFDHLDLDSDNDGITDNVEAQSTDGYVAPTEIDSDGDGLDDAYETGGLTPVDTDGDGTADVIDTDSDNDGTSDTDEAGHGITQSAIDASGDADGDGIADVVDDVSGWDVNDTDIDGSGDFALADSDGDTAADGTGATPMTADLDFRDATISSPDTDGDGITDDIDVDDDNDGILDINEGNTPNPVDFSGGLTFTGQTVTVGGTDVSVDSTLSNDGANPSDGNALGDLRLSTITYEDPPDPTNDEQVQLDFDIGVQVTVSHHISHPGDFNGTDGGITSGDAWQLTATGGFTLYDPANELVILAQTADSITFGVNPALGIIPDGTGSWSVVTNAPVTSITMQGGGDPASVVNVALTGVDSDGDGILDHQDLDSDNDGITDNVEAQSTDGYTAPTGTDTDGDGLDDAYETGGLTPVDTDGDGTADVLDTDSDNDGTADVDEAGHGVTQSAIDASGDTDGDGIADVVDDVAGWDVNDADIDGSGNFTLADLDNDTAADGSGATPMSADFDFRDAVPCFTPGTLIATENGDVPVEDIRPGMMVHTVDNGLQPVRWVGAKTLGQVDLATHTNLRPVVIRKGAFGNRRKMLVSPQHGLMVSQEGEDYLIRAKHAAQTLGGKYARIDKHCELVTYIHIMFDQHELIYAEGAVTESFYPGPMALRGLERAVSNELLTLFPDLEDIAFGDGHPSDRYGESIRPYLLRKDARKFADQL